MRARKKQEAATSNEIVPLAVKERDAIFDAIRVTDGDKLEAARLLGIGKTTLYRKLKEYGLADRAGPTSATTLISAQFTFIGQGARCAPRNQNAIATANI